MIKAILTKPLDGHPEGAEREFEPADFERLLRMGAVEHAPAPTPEPEPEPAPAPVVSPSVDNPLKEAVVPAATDADGIADGYENAGAEEKAEPAPANKMEATPSNKAAQSPRSKSR